MLGEWNRLWGLCSPRCFSAFYCMLSLNLLLLFSNYRTWSRGDYLMWLHHCSACTVFYFDRHHRFSLGLYIFGMSLCYRYFCSHGYQSMLYNVLCIVWILCLLLGLSSIHRITLRWRRFWCLPLLCRMNCSYNFVTN